MIAGGLTAMNEKTRSTSPLPPPRQSALVASNVPVFGEQLGTSPRRSHSDALWAAVIVLATLAAYGVVLLLLEPGR